MKVKRKVTPDNNVKPRRKRARSCSSYVSANSWSTCSDVSYEREPSRHWESVSRKVKYGVKKSIPAAIVLWAFHKIPSRNGLTARTVINFLKKHFRVQGTDDPRKTGITLGHMLAYAVEFGILEKCGNRLFLKQKD